MEPSGKHFECQELRPEDASMTRSAGVVCTLEMERMLPAPEADDPQKGSELQAPRTEHPRGRNEDEVDGVVNRETPKQDSMASSTVVNIPEPDTQGSVELQPLSTEQSRTGNDERPIYHILATKAKVNRFRKRIENDLEKEDYAALKEKDERKANFLANLIESRQNKECLIEKLRITLDSSLPHEEMRWLLTNEDQNGYSAMENAAFLGKTEFLTLMVNRYCELPFSDPLNGSKIFPVSSKNRTLLHSAASGGYIEICEFILNKWPGIINEQDIDGFTALHMASAYKHDEVIVLLLQRKASLLLMNKIHEPAFVYAMCSENAKEHLLQRFNEAFRFKDTGPYSAKKDTVIFSLSIVVPHTASDDSNDKNTNPLVSAVAAKPIVSSSSSTSIPSKSSGSTNDTKTNPIVLTERAKTKVSSSPSTAIPSIQYSGTNDTDENRIVPTEGSESVPLIVIQTGVLTENKNMTTVRETEVLANLVKVKFNVTQDFLLHPLCKTFVELKMQRLRLFCIQDLFLYLFYVCLFTSLSICRGAVSTTFYSNNVTHEINITTPLYNCSSDIFGLQIATTILSALKVIINLCLLIYYVKKSCTENYKLDDKKVSFPARSKRLKTKFAIPLLTTIFRLTIHVTTIVVTWLLFESAKFIIPFVLLQHWYWLIYKLEIFEYSGKYVMMLKTVLKRFIGLFLTFLPIYIGFVLAFSSAFRDEALLQFPMMLMTGFSMMTGEHNTKDIFESNHVEFTSSIVFIAFIVVLWIVVMNLLVGLTVADTTLLEKEGEARLVVQNLKRINIAEEIAEVIEKTGISFISKQLSVLPCSNGKDRDGGTSVKNGENCPRKIKSDKKHKPGEIELSLKECEKSDLLFTDEKEKSRYCWLQRQCAYYLYAICGVVLCDTSLYRKYPINDKIQAEVEITAMKSSKAKKADNLNESSA